MAMFAIMDPLFLSKNLRYSQCSSLIECGLDKIFKRCFLNIRIYVTARYGVGMCHELKLKFLLGLAFESL